MTDEAATVTGIVAMIRVRDVMASAAFYRNLGFEIGNAQPKEPPFHWAWLYQPKAANWKAAGNLMLVAGETAESPEIKAKLVLFYVYVSDLPSLRAQLIANGVRVGDIVYPEYLPEGECGVTDPDGYALMLAQAGRDTP
ncbi:MAG TPA: VOC family protein [Vicinamibacterales bacterium]|nr:VOC family protein [Vicinamibacterales bacterium]